jgi:hypothetical protein
MKLPLRTALIHAILVTALATRIAVGAFKWSLRLVKLGCFVLAVLAVFRGVLPALVPLFLVGLFVELVDRIFFGSSPYRPVHIGGAKLNDQLAFDPYWAFGKRP